MYEIRFHGRGGQGAVMAAQTIAEAAILEGMQAQAFPFFGAERRGAPVTAFARIDSQRISVKTQVYEPDMLVIMDESLIDIEPVAMGMKEDGVAVINTKLSPDELDLGVSVKAITVDATAVAMEFLKAPIVNTAILGAMACASDIVSLDSIVQAIKNRFGEKLGEKAGRINAESAKAAYERSMAGVCKGEREMASKKAWLPTWQEMPPSIALKRSRVGDLDIGPGSAWQNFTGNWRTRTPRYDHEKCVGCMRCWFICPDAVIHKQGKKVSFDYRYCKGCGVCTTVCPVNAIDMVKGVGP